MLRQYTLAYALRQRLDWEFCREGSPQELTHLLVPINVAWEKLGAAGNSPVYVLSRGCVQR